LVLGDFGNPKIFTEKEEEDFHREEKILFSDLT